eukprot:CAMPEP_0170086800 /NCGR_PEP_ID=MMETSP0019_2-20121128/21390_1 /TAXON_ID=98059 /ORGANISM="Dinobryon sp., Strain UTEXLB2267" /LENGTH=36 /DNA_ID= /DNA_START= /DNA_END= /DNA_ORIENTATION=
MPSSSSPATVSISAPPAGARRPLVGDHHRLPHAKEC